MEMSPCRSFRVAIRYRTSDRMWAEYNNFVNSYDKAAIAVLPRCTTPTARKMAKYQWINTGSHYTLLLQLVSDCNKNVIEIPNSH